MLSLFQRKRASVAAAPPPTPVTNPPKGLLRPEPAASLLATPRRQKLLEHIWQRTSLSRTQFTTLYRAPLERYAELVQQFPASESHHHAYPGGMLDHGLEIVAYSLKLRQSHLLPIGASPEDQAVQSEAWTAAVAYAALLHDIGKIAVDLHVKLVDGSTWHPWHGPLHQPYRFRYRDDREYRLHSAATGLLYHQLLDAHLLDWLSGYPALWGPLLYVLAGQYEHAGILGELVVQADRASVAQELGGDPARATAAPKHALQRKLLDGLRYLLKEELKLNQPEASDGWLTEDALWLVSKTVSDKLRAQPRNLRLLGRDRQCCGLAFGPHLQLALRIGPHPVRQARLGHAQRRGHGRRSTPGLDLPHCLLLELQRVLRSRLLLVQFMLPSRHSPGWGLCTPKVRQTSTVTYWYWSRRTHPLIRTQNGTAVRRGFKVLDAWTHLQDAWNDR